MEKSQLQKKLDIIDRIIYDSQKSLQITKYIYEQRGKINNDPSINFIMNSMYRLCIIDLHKLFSLSSRDKYSFQEILKSNSVNIKSYKWDDLKSKIEKSLSAMAFEISMLYKIRSKLVAHVDPDIVDAKIHMLSLESLQKLIHLSVRILNLIKDAHDLPEDKIINRKDFLHLHFMESIKFYEDSIKEKRK